MNSEELEISLRTEFESYLNNVRAEMKQELSDFQKMVETEVDKHRSQLDDAFKNISSRLESGTVVDDALKESVVEHLRLARDDGAQLAASAAAEAEMLSMPGGGIGGFDQIRDAIAEISSKTSQSAILKSLTDHCSRFTARGAFFIIKNDNFVGWEVFGKDASGEDHTTRDIHFSISSDTILKESVQELRTVEGRSGDHKHDSKFLKSLKFGEPASMFAVPLVARGRGVAVLYADGGPNGEPVQVDAIEVLVRVAGLTVELLASAAGAVRPQAEVRPIQQTEEVDSDNYSVEASNLYDEPVVEHDVTELHDVDTIEPRDAFEDGVEAEQAPAEVQIEEDAVSEETLHDASGAAQETLDDESYLMTEAVDEMVEVEAVSEYEAVSEVTESSPEMETTEFAFVSAEPEVVEVEEITPVTEPSDVQPEVLTNGNGRYHAEEPATEAPTVPLNGKRRGRNIDLPIEVSEDERDKHTKARSFARLLVSEIKLYNPDKVNDGRQSNDLYDRLREAIDRSREMYNQRIDAPVATRFDYFHYELVNGLAEGDESRLGSSYPGASS